MGYVKLGDSHNCYLNTQLIVAGDKIRLAFCVSFDGGADADGGDEDTEGKLKE